MNSNAIKIASDFIKQHEGFDLTCYLDSAGIPTVGYGHRVWADEHLSLGQTITQTEADNLFQRDLGYFIMAIDKLVTVSLTDNQKAALVSFCFNEGVTAFANSTLLRKLNAADLSGAAQEFARWVYVTDEHGQKEMLSGLVNRRNAEKALFLTPIHPQTLTT